MNNITKFSLSLLVVFGLLSSNSFGLNKHVTTGKISGKVVEATDNFTTSTAADLSQKSNTVIPFNPTMTGYGADLLSTINRAYKPWNHRADLKIDKTILSIEIGF